MVATQEEPCAYAKLLGRLDGQEFQCYVMSLPSTLGRSSGTSGTDGDRKPAGFIDLGKSKAISREHATIDWAPAERKYKITCLGKNGMVVGGKYTSRGGVAALGSRTPIKLGPAHLYFLLPESVETGGGSGAGAGGQPPSNGELGPVVRPLSSMSGSDVVETPRKEQSPTTGQGHLPSPQGRSQTGAAPTPPVAPSLAAAKPSPISFDEMVDKAFGSPELSAMAAAEGLSSGDVQNWVMQNFPVWNEEGAKMRTLAVGIEAALAKNYASSGADRWKESPVHIMKRAKIAADHPSPAVTNANAVLASEQPGAQASSNGTLPHVSSAAPGTSPGVQIALGQVANAEQMAAAPARARLSAPAASVPAAKVPIAAAIQPVACASVAGAAAAAAGSGMGILVQGSVGGEEEGGGIDVGIEDHM